MFVVPALLVIALATPFGYDPDWVGIAVLLLLLSLLTALVSAWSNALGMIMKETGSLAAIVTGLQLPLTLLSGVLLPLSLAPEWMRVLAHLNPLYYAVTAARELSAGSMLDADVAARVRGPRRAHAADVRLGDPRVPPCRALMAR